jgi:hypothetical protein
MRTYREILFSFKSEANSAICDNIGRHYGKWKKPSNERKILHVFTYMWNIVFSLLKVELMQAAETMLNRA